MLTRRAVLAGLLALAAAPTAVCAAQSRKHGAHKAHETHKSSGRTDAVIDISHMTVVSDFRTLRKRSHILGIIHKASEGGDWRDPLYTQRRTQAEAAGLLWGAYHFGTHQYSGTEQARMFLSVAKPGPTTLLALDLEFNDQNPSNTMQLRQAEDFVRTVRASTGRWPMIYTNPTWADGKPSGDCGRSLGGRVTEHSVLARCPLWLADYRTEPQIPDAWRGKGWHFWQYAGDAEDGGPHSGKTRSVPGVDRCDRNFFRGDVAALIRFWKKEAGRLLDT